jgi:predicted DNA-binding transcriptional regulator AlpA
MTAIERERLRAAAAATYIGVSRSTLAKWRMRGEGLPYHRCGPRIVYYYRDEIDAWLADCDQREQRTSAK